MTPKDSSGLGMTQRGRLLLRMCVALFMVSQLIFAPMAQRVFHGVLTARAEEAQVGGEEPAPEPAPEPTAEPTAEPTLEPTAEPTLEPTAEPTAESPSPTATSSPSPTPSLLPCMGAELLGMWVLPDEDDERPGTQLARGGEAQVWVVTIHTDEMEIRGELLSAAGAQVATLKYGPETDLEAIRSAYDAAAHSELLTPAHLQQIDAAITLGQARVSRSVFMVLSGIGTPGVNESFTATADISADFPCSALHEDVTVEILGDAPAPTPAATSAPTATVTPTATLVPTDTPTPTSTLAPEPTSTVTYTSTLTPEATADPSTEPVESPTPTQAAEAAPTAIPDLTATPKLGPTSAIDPTPTAEGATPVPEPSPTETGSREFIETPTPLLSPTPSPTPEPYLSPIFTPTPTTLPKDDCESSAVLALWVLPDDDLVQAGTQIAPLPGEPREIQIWMIARTAQEATASAGWLWSGEGYADTISLRVAPWDEAEQALQDGIASGALTDEQLSIIEDARMMQQALVFTGTLILLPDAPAGNYQVVADLVAGACAPLFSTAPLQYLPLLLLEIDFDSLPFGDVVPMGQATISGDTAFSPGDGRPTIRNMGNSPGRLEVRFTSMALPNGLAEISDFRVTVLDETLRVGAGNPVMSTQALEPGMAAAIHFAFMAPSQLPGGRYSGSVSLTLVP